ncbi:helix-turn-helix domain-containing protein [Rhizobium sp. G21]|uniref:helix-turn-helix domain-containing protein n=1 Tax=Rhizobium sp. G21 TaxID=2758439 RepID=UPI001602A1B0|nr:helix-turn-helix transcriptional regulator [Rhizobium sp. G21]MBB1250231.1 XRE family transcriptional regulator [Rhizobium sp. G21]
MTDHHSVVGGSLEDFLEYLGEKEAVYGAAIKQVLAWQIDEERKLQALSKSDMAEKMGTSRSQLDRVLDPANIGISLDTLERAARSLGKRLKIELVDA